MECINGGDNMMTKKSKVKMPKSRLTKEITKKINALSLKELRILLVYVLSILLNSSAIYDIDKIYAPAMAIYGRKMHGVKPKKRVGKRRGNSAGLIKAINANKRMSQATKDKAIKRLMGR